MMLVLVLGTAIAFSSCGKDDEGSNGGNNGGGNGGSNGVEVTGDANSVTINGKSHKIEECFCEGGKGKSAVVFCFEDDEMEGMVAAEFDGTFPSGDAKAADFEVEYGYQNGGADYEGRTQDVSCNIKVSDGRCTFKAGNVKLKIKREDGSESFDATVNVNYSGPVEIGDTDDEANLDPR